MTTVTTTRSSTDSCSPVGMSSQRERRRPSLPEDVVRTAVDLISTSSRTPVRFNLMEARCLQPDSPNFTDGTASMRELRVWCFGCPVVAECLADAIVWENGGDPHHVSKCRTRFVRGGMAADKRRRLILKLRKQGVIHGRDS